MKTILYALAVAGSVSMISQAAHAGVSYSFTSTGTFSNSSRGVDALGNDRNQIGWGGSDGWFGYSGSTMTANQLSNQTGTAPATADTIGVLTWFNASTDAAMTAAQISTDYNLTLNFTSPMPGGKNSETLKLTIVNTPNTLSLWWCGSCGYTVNSADTTTFSSPTSFIVDGLLISNISFSEEGDGAFNNGVWTNPEGSTSKLYIKANITQVPEPAPMAILATGLVGLGLIGSARKRT